MSNKFEIGDEVVYKFNATTPNGIAIDPSLFPNGIVIDKSENSDKICLFFDSKASGVWADAALFYKTGKHFDFAEHLRDMASKAEYEKLLERRCHENSIKFGEVIKFKTSFDEGVGMVVQSGDICAVMDSRGHTILILNTDEIIERTGIRYKHADEFLDFLQLLKQIEKEK